ncbi:cystathionine beta-lyase PatB [Anaerolineaceae bacterium]|nr:cystathionine beta-lyase PatB [Anaerolineaceae bacterium]
MICERLQRLYQWTVQPEALLFVPGQVVGLNLACRAIGETGDGVLLQPPVYYPFMSAVANQQREVQFAPLAHKHNGSIISYAADLDALRAPSPRAPRVFCCASAQPGRLDV